MGEIHLFPRLLLAFVILGVSASVGQTAVVTTIEQTDPAIAYTGTWFANNSPSNSGGSSTTTNYINSQAVLSFNGTGITWLGVLDPGNGEAWVYLDGAMSIVDCYSATTQYQQPLFTASGLSAGPHTLSIQVPHIRKNINASGSWVYIDSFQIMNGSTIVGGVTASPGLVQQTDPSLIYTGIWDTNSAAYLSSGSSSLATNVGSGVTIKFNGTGITWLAYRDQWSGIATVSIDSAAAATVDTYSAPAQAQYPMYSVAGLAMGTHILSIGVTGTHSAGSADSWIWVDAFNVAGPAGAAPVVSTGGVVNAASFTPAPNNQIASGQIISVFGGNFLAAGRADSSGLPLATQLGSSNTSVTVCGRTVPLFSVFPGQINAQVPWECPPTGPSQLTVTANGQSSAAQTVTLVAASPGIFWLSAADTGNGAILHADNSLVNPARPARGGETVVVYCTGLGATIPSFATGSPAAAGNATANSVTALIGGKTASVVFSGLTAGFVGLYQVNVVVPAGLSGSQPILITSAGSAGGAASQSGVTLSLAP
jgi:uncharacterized protein (TIGR03437 family)